MTYTIRLHSRCSILTVCRYKKLRGIRYSNGCIFTRYPNWRLSRMREEKDMAVSEFFYMAFWSIVLTLIAAFSTASLGGAIPYPYGAPFGSAYTPPFYQVNPGKCNSTLYTSVNGTGGEFADHFLGQWNLFVHFGACPVDNLPTTCDSVVGKTPYCGTYYTSCLSTYFNRKQERNVIPNSKTWSQTYDHTPYTWSDLDNGNAMMGYKSNFDAGARIWSSTTNLIIAATTLMWIGVLLFFLGPFFKSRPYIFRFTPQILFFIGFLFWSIVLGVTSTTSQIDPLAWSSYFFQTCTVQVVKGPIFYYGAGIISFCALFFVSEIIFLSFVGYYPNSYDDEQQYSSVSLVDRKRKDAERNAL